MLNVKRCDYGVYAKNYLNRNTGKSLSLQSSPIHQANAGGYSRSTNSTPQHFYKQHRSREIEKNGYNYPDSNEETNLEDYLEFERGSSLEDLNCELNNQNSSNDDEYDNSEESNDGEHCGKTNYAKQRFKLNGPNHYDQICIKHSKSYQNDFFGLESSPAKINLLDKPTSLSLSGNNLNNLNNGVHQKDPISPRTKKFEFFVMTGTTMINLSRSNSEENPMIFADIANFRADKGVLNKQKIRKSKEGRRKGNSKVNNSDQMRECLSPEIEPGRRDCDYALKNDCDSGDRDQVLSDDEQAASQLELENNSINDLLNSKEGGQADSRDESLIVTCYNDRSSIELTCKESDQQPSDDEASDERSDEKNDPEEGEPAKEKASFSLPLASDESGNRRYPTFIQQAAEADLSPIGEQPSLQQKSIDEASAHRLARRLYNLDKFKKADIARHLSKNNEYCSTVAQEYCNFFDFTDLSLIEALRQFLSKFCLVGETQERERVLLHFSKRFFACNPSTFASTDSVYTLTCAIMMLNSDLHGECVTKKMSLNDFVENLRSLNDGQNFSRDLLKELYNKIKADRLEWCIDEDSEQLKDDYSVFSNCGLATANSILEMPNTSSSVEYKRGYILRKRTLQANGKRVSLGKRKWKSFYAVLRDNFLYLHKDDQSFAKSQIYDSVKNSIRIHHAVAFLTDYKKRKHVFKLCTADGGEWLISVNSKQEQENWMDALNFVAGCISAPIDTQSSSAAILNGKKKYPLKSVLPVNSTTKYQFKEQLSDHESRRIRLNDEIQEITQSLRLNYNLVGRKAKNAVLQLRYLKHEYERYTQYIKVMKKVKQNPANSILEKASKSLASKSKPLTTLVIGEEQSDDGIVEE